MAETTPIAVVSTQSLGSLGSGVYTIIATQSLGAQSNTSTTTATIADQTNPLVFTLTQTKVCGPSSGAITANVTSGTAVSYAITSGPVTRPAQASNVFNNLPAGQYEVRLVDSCNSVYVVTYQVTNVATAVTIAPPVFGEVVLPSCNTITVWHDFVSTGADNVIMFPLTFTYTVFPPGGGTPTTVSQVVTTGLNVGINTISSNIPFYNDQSYTYNLQVTDACGNVFPLNGNVVNKEFDLLLVSDNPECIQFRLSAVPQYFVPPYTVSFILAPAGFVPANFNAAHPTFSSAAAIYGTPANPVPMGTYRVQVTDACGRTATKELLLTNDSPPTFTTSTNAATCLGQVSISLSGRGIDTVVITDAPNGYTPTPPHDVSANILPTGFVMLGLPFGHYIFRVTDKCGVVYDVEINLAPSGGDFEIESTQRPGCAIGEGSLRLRIPGGVITGVTIMTADDDFVPTLPHVADALIDGTGVFFMNSLPEGNYTFKVANLCGIEKTESIVIEGYHEQVSTVDIVPHCGSFDLDLHHTSNGNYVQSFWLQKYNPGTNTWGHPQTGVPYTEGNLPSAANSVFLTNNAVNPTLIYSGQFRVVKAFHTFSNGSSSNNRCITVLKEFTFDGQVDIVEVYGFPCVNGTTEVFVDAVGVEPLNYAIVDSNDPNIVLVNNGTSDVFAGLTTGTYTIRVTDPCGSSRVQSIDINDLPEFEISESNLCEGEDGQLYVTPLSFLTYAWWKEGAPGTILSTTNVLNLSPFDPVAHAGTYHVTLSSPTMPSSCINGQVLDYTVDPDIANPGVDNTVTYCNDGESLDLATYLGEHDTDGVWTDVDNTGELNGSVLTTAGLAEGIYHFTYSVTDSCGNVKDATITVEINSRPETPVANVLTSPCQGESVYLTANTQTLNATYQWTGPNNFTSNEQNPIIEQAGVSASGIYQVTVISANGCVSPAAQVTVTVKPVPVFTIEGSSTLCSGQSGELSVMPDFNDPAVVYQWYFSNELITDVTDGNIIIFEPGAYKVIVTNNGCSSEQSVVVTENTNAFAVELEAGCKDFDYVISVTNTVDLPNATYDWSGPGGFTAEGSEIVITDGLPGDYTVEVTNADGCTASAVQTVISTGCMVPKGISPGDADFNNTFDLSNMDVEELKIYNRYGREVYAKSNYKNEWYGQSQKGQDLPTGTYYYMITLPAGKNLTGWVYINRMN